jgi:hypothetical protein
LTLQGEHLASLYRPLEPRKEGAYLPYQPIAKKPHIR